MLSMTQTDDFTNLDDIPLIEIAERIRDKYGVKPTLRDIVSYHEIADRAYEEFGVKINVNTVRQWKAQRLAWERKGRPARRVYEQVMPEQIAMRNRSVSIWLWHEVREWMIKTGKVVCRTCGGPLATVGGQGHRGLCENCRPARVRGMRDTHS